MLFFVLYTTIPGRAANNSIKNNERKNGKLEYVLIWLYIGLGLIDYRIVFCPHMAKVYINYIPVCCREHTFYLDQVTQTESELAIVYDA